MTDIVERLRLETSEDGSLLRWQARTKQMMSNAADRIEDLENQLLSINPAMKCRDGCAVVWERFGE